MVRIHSPRPRFVRLTEALTSSRERDMSSSKQRLTARITGRVQGVGYRYFAEGQASVRALTGWVRNEADGSVALVAEGDARLLAQLVEALERGPVGARVDHVDARWCEATGELTSFEIRR